MLDLRGLHLLLLEFLALKEDLLVFLHYIEG
jgi:hypothetical protein